MLEKGRGPATDARSPMARIWARVFATLECTTYSPALLERLKWMPAHGAVSTIGQAVGSGGSKITAVEWQANRLVDALAKKAAQLDRLPGKFMELIDPAAEAVEFFATKLGT
eukprot:3094285-Karenia_brevis.AAC.1